MKTTLLFLLSAISVAAAHGSTTTDSSITWTIYSGYQSTGTLDSAGTAFIIQPCTPGSLGCISSAILGDNNGAYASGGAGISNCGIHFSSGTYDATLGFSSRSTRTVGFKLNSQLAFNGNTTLPSWATQTVTGGGFLNVSHILYPTTALGSGIEVTPPASLLNYL
jgi:hypothetical protein